MTLPKFPCVCSLAQFEHFPLLVSFLCAVSCNNRSSVQLVRITYLTGNATRFICSCLFRYRYVDIATYARVPLNKAFFTFSRILEFGRGRSSGQQRHEGPGDGAAVGAAEYRTVRRRSLQGDHLRGERWWRRRAPAPAVCHVQRWRTAELRFLLYDGVTAFCHGKGRAWVSAVQK